MNWCVLHLRPRSEKKMAECCAANSIEHYLPLRRETKVYQRRKVSVLKPVFPGYIFASLDQRGRLAALRTNYIVRVLTPPDERQLLLELEQIRRALEVDQTLGACAALAKGRRVRITGGPFMGVEGVVAVVRGASKVMLNVEMIGRGVVVEVASEFLDVVE